MRQNNLEIEKYRVKSGIKKSDASYGNNGVFIIPGKRFYLVCLVSDGAGWEHVSVKVNAHPSTPQRLPTWDEMNFIKQLFWDDAETVVQFHPRKDNYVNFHPFVLHLWKQVDSVFELPPRELV